MNGNTEDQINPDFYLLFRSIMNCQRRTILTLICQSSKSQVILANETSLAVSNLLNFVITHDASNFRLVMHEHE